MGLADVTARDIDPDAVAAAADRFYAKCKPTESGCVEWTAFRNDEGYGYFRVGRAVEKAHRVAYVLANGPIPDDRRVIMHRCDNRACVNPDHLVAGTNACNVRDRENKGRGNHRNGAHGRNARLTIEQVRRIRERIANGEVQRHIARDYGVSVSTISVIKLGKAWQGWV